MAKDTEAVKSPETIDELPDSPIASAPAGQPLDQAGDSAATLESMRGMIREEMQSIKDTRIGKSETRLDNLESAIAQYEAEKGGTVDPKALSKLQGVQREKELLERILALEGGNKPEVSAGAGATDWAGKQASILDNAGIPKDDPRIVELLRTASDKQDFVTKLEEQTFAWKQADANKPQPSAGTVAQNIPSVPTGSGDYTVDKYTEDMLAARGNKAKLQRIKAAAKADGVEVDNIGFT